MTEEHRVTEQMIDAARDVPIIRLLVDCGIDLDTGDESIPQQMACPLHGDGQDQKKSARYYPDSNRVKCWGCGVSRDTIEWFKDFYNASFNEAVLTLVKDYTDLELEDLGDGKYKRREVEGKAVLELLEREARKQYPRMTVADRIKLSITFDNLWAVGCSRESQRKVENFLKEIVPF